MASPENTKSAGMAAFAHPGFRLYQLARFCVVLSTEMQSVAVGWQVYEITKRPLYLGYVVLVLTCNNKSYMVGMEDAQSLGEHSPYRRRKEPA